MCGRTPSSESCETGRPVKRRQHQVCASGSAASQGALLRTSTGNAPRTFQLRICRQVPQIPDRTLTCCQRCWMRYELPSRSNRHTWRGGGRRRFGGSRLGPPERLAGATSNAGSIFAIAVVRARRLASVEVSPRWRYERRQVGERSSFGSWRPSSPSGRPGSFVETPFSEFQKLETLI